VFLPRNYLPRNDLSRNYLPRNYLPRSYLTKNYLPLMFLPRKVQFFTNHVFYKMDLNVAEPKLGSVYISDPTKTLIFCRHSHCLGAAARQLRVCSLQLVVRQVNESWLKDSNLLAIFAGEREDSSH
jgi:hypothetical protein